MEKRINIYNILAIVFLIAISLVIYLNSFKNGFVWDDSLLVENNTLIKGYNNILRIFTTHLFSGVGSESNFYRPIQNLSYLFDYSLWKLNPLGYHLTNVVIHIVNSIFIYFIILIISRNNLVSLLTSLLFTVHPIHTEAVTYISGRADPLSVMFGLLSLLMFLKYRLSEINFKKNLYYSVSLLTFIFSLLSKETMVILPFLIIICDYSAANKKQRSLYSYIFLFLTLAIYVALRITILQFSSEKSILPNLGLYSSLLTACYVIIQYLKLIVFPFNLHMARQITPAISFFQPRVMFSIILIFVIFYFIARGIKRAKLILLGTAWFFIGLLPISNIFLPLNARMAEHWLYLPSIGIFLIIAVGLNRLIRSKLPKITTISLVIFVLVYFSFLTAKQNSIWKDEITLYQYTLKFSPSSAKVHYNLANAFDKIGLFDKAVAEYKRAIILRPQYPDAYNNLGTVYLKRGEFKEAAASFIESLNLDPASLQTLINLAETYRSMKEFDKAIETYGKAISINPKNIQANINLGAIYAMKKDFLKAIEKYEAALKVCLEPDLKAKIYYNLGVAYLQIDKVDRGKDALEEALKFNPNLIQAKENLEILRENGF